MSNFIYVWEVTEVSAQGAREFKAFSPYSARGFETPLPKIYSRWKFETVASLEAHEIWRFLKLKPDVLETISQSF